MATENKKEEGTIIIIKKRKEEIETQQVVPPKSKDEDQLISQDETKKRIDLRKRKPELQKPFRAPKRELKERKTPDQGVPAEREDERKTHLRERKYDERREPRTQERETTEPKEQLFRPPLKEQKKEEETIHKGEVLLKAKTPEKQEKPPHEFTKEEDIAAQPAAQLETLEQEMKREEDEERTDGFIGEIEVFAGREDIIPYRAKRFFSYRKKKKKKFYKLDEPQEKKEEKQEIKKIRISGLIRVAELSKLTGIKSSEIIKKLLELGREVTINHFITADEAELVCADYNISVEREEFDETKYFDTSPDPEESLRKRPPVVVVMGHVDHGKTTLLDAIRETNVAEKEVGGITQSIGAYTVEVNGQAITFIDTPGHEAFTAMRARGAKVADIAVLVVASDEGVKPQTEEAISHAKAAGLPIIVALNKIDKPGANPELVKNQLANLGLIPDDWGGDTLFANISAKKRIGINDLLEKILLQADILNLKANPSRAAEGVIIESSLDKGLGATATVIVQRGTLKKGDVFVAGLMWGRVRNIFSDRGSVLKEVTPGFPAKIIIGGDELPLAGDKIYVVKDEEIASKIVEERRLKEGKRTHRTISLEDIFEKIKESGENKLVLPLILKTSSAGALEALEKELSLIKHPNIEIRMIHKGIGIVSQSDVNLAAASGGIIIGYGVGADKNAQNLAKMLKVQIRLYKIIYEIVDDIRKALQGMLKPKEKEVFVGRGRILKIFKLSIGKVLGCYAETGKFIHGLNIRVKRDGEVIGMGKIISLKRFKDSVQEISEGNEFGLMIEGVQDVKENDIIECFKIETEEINIT